MGSNGLVLTNNISSETASRCITSVAFQHADAASALWLCRDVFVFSPHFSLSDLSDQDKKLESHLDILRQYGTSFGLEGAVENTLEKTFFELAFGA